MTAQRDGCIHNPELLKRIPAPFLVLGLLVNYFLFSIFGSTAALRDPVVVLTRRFFLTVS